MPKRLASAVMMLGVCAFAGFGQAALWVGVVIGAIELLAYHARRHLPVLDRDMTAGYIAWIWVQNSISVMAYLSPSYFLAQHSSTAMLLAAMLWTFGVIVHISNSFASLPLYNWTLMVPSLGMTVALIVEAGQSSYAPSTSGEWIVTVALLGVYGANTFETLTKQKDTQAALDLARQEATVRLRALEYVSRHDNLTGLLNRAAFDDELGRMLSDKPLPQPVAVYIIDLDGFKPINDSYGHSAGDAVLRTVADRLRVLMQGQGLVARLGGDEFAIAIPGREAEGVVLRMAGLFTQEIELPIDWQNKSLRIAASIGVAVTRLAGRSVEAMCSGADRAMYRAKADSEVKALLFDPAHYDRTPSLEDRQRIIDAFRNGDIRPYYQPKVVLGTLQTCGFEALARWVNPDGTILPPAQFIPRINELGLQGEFLAHMTQQVLRDVQDMVDQGLDPGEVSVNLPEIALATHTGREELDQLLARYPRARPHITLEITEDVFIARAADMIQNSIAHFRRAGQRISLDDFGTGFASFQHLRQLDFDELKIDASFVADLAHDRSARILVAGFLSMAAGLGVAVIAEGIETTQQLAFLRRTGCLVGQGFLFGHALPLEETKVRLMTEQSGGAMGSGAA